MPTTDIERPRFARMYLKASGNAERRGATEHRRRLLDGLAGTVRRARRRARAELPALPAGGHRSDRARARADAPRRTPPRRPRTRPCRCACSPASPTRCPSRMQSADVAVASLVLCSVPDQDRALAELRRVLRPGGELRFYEHVIPNCQPRRLLLQAADHSGLWPKIAGGCHPARDTGAAIERAGFTIKSSERIMFAASRFEPAIPFILGTVQRS